MHKRETVYFDPSVKKMKEELSTMDEKNNELVQEVIRLKSMLKDSVNENEMNNELVNELHIKEELIAEKDKIISDHLKALELA